MLTALMSNIWVLVLAVVLGFVMLVFGSDWLVDGASAIAKRFGVSELVIGLTVVAVGTSMPEFIVSLLAALQGNTEIAITNILGSNSINTFVILGLTALIYPVISQSSSRRFDIPWNLFAGVLVFLFATYTRPAAFRWDNFGEFSFEYGFISGIGGFVLLLCFAIFMWHSFRIARPSDASSLRDDLMPDKDSAVAQPAATASADGDGPSLSLPVSFLLVLAGIAFLVLGGEAVVRGATGIAHRLGVSDAVIGLTIVALGTSLPELATSFMAAAKHNCDLALGNVLGSNIFNVFFILGTNAVIHPLPVYRGLWLDAAMVTLSAIMLMCFVYFTRTHIIKRWHGAMLLLVYAAYLAYRLLTL